MNINVNPNINNTNFTGAFKFTDSRLSRIKPTAVGLKTEVKNVLGPCVAWYRNDVLYAVTKTKEDNSAISKLNKLGVQHLYKDNAKIATMEKDSALLDFQAVESFFI